MYVHIYVHIQSHAYIIDNSSTHHDVSINHRPIMYYLHEYIHTHIYLFINVCIYIHTHKISTIYRLSTHSYISLTMYGRIIDAP